jgi:putative phosphoesterase
MLAEPSAIRHPAVIAVGVLSDTHGHLYAEVKKLLEGVDHIIHAGDIGASRVLAELKAMAPVTAVRGNCDYDQWALSLPVHTALEVGGARIAVGHVGRQVQQWAEAGAAVSGTNVFEAVVFGHSHIALVERRAGVLYLNPGSAGPRRFDRPRTMAKLVVRSAAVGDPGVRPHVDAEIYTLD